MRKVDLVVVGSGLFGSMVAKYARSQHKEVLLIDNNEKMSGSKCSAGVFTDSWITKIVQEVDVSLGVLEKLVDISSIQFHNPVLLTDETFLRIDVDGILKEEQDYGYITEIKDKGKLVKYKDSDGQIREVATKATILCTGSFTDTVLNRLGYSIRGIDGQWGVTLELSGSIEQNLIKTWAPYKQMYAFNFKRKVAGERKHMTYFGDGSMVKNIQKNDARIAKVEDRCMLHATDDFNLNPDKIVDMVQGVRPYLKKGSHEWIEKHDDFVWSATGGAKNTTVLSGFIALEIFQRAFRGK